MVFLLRSVLAAFVHHALRMSHQVGIPPMQLMLILLLRMLNSDEGYVETPTTSYSGHARPIYCDDKQSVPQGVPGAIQSPMQPGVFEFDSNGRIPNSIPGYPVMQPNRPMAVQPMNRSENMVYPDFSSSQDYAGQIQQSTPLNSHMISPQSYGPPPPLGIPGAPTFSSAVYPNNYQQAAEGAEGSNQARGLDIVLTSQKPAQAKRGPFRTNDEREATAETRKIGSCIRCRMQRIRVSIH